MGSELPQGETGSLISFCTKASSAEASCNRYGNLFQGYLLGDIASQCHTIRYSILRGAQLLFKDLRRKFDQNLWTSSGPKSVSFDALGGWARKNTVTVFATPRAALSLALLPKNERFIWILSNRESSSPRAVAAAMREAKPWLSRERPAAVKSVWRERVEDLWDRAEGEEVLARTCARRSSSFVSSRCMSMALAGPFNFCAFSMNS